MNYTFLLEEIVAWARAHEDVEALILTGSRARGSSVYDALSDLDLEIISARPASLEASDAWIASFAPLLTILRLETPTTAPG